MQVNLQKRENTQTTILALLLSCKEGCTLKKLDCDYYELEGEHIPWKDLGYISLLSFLRSMPKIVQIEYKNDILIVKGVASEKSKHVGKLIAGQKVQKQPIGRKSYKPSHYFPMTAPPKINIPAEILSKLIRLINDHPDGIDKNYVLEKVQTFMPFVNITMKDIEEQLHELSHTVFQTNNKIYPIQCKVKNYNHSKINNDMSCIESTIVSHNKQECKSSLVTVAGDENLGDILCYDEDDVIEFIPNYTESITKTKSTSNFIKESVFKCQYQETEPTSTLGVYQNDSHNLFNHNTVQVKMEFDNSIKKEEENFLHKNDVEILINERVKFRLEKLIQNHPNGIWCADLPGKYLEEYKVPLNYTELGFNSVREFASQLPETFYCVQPHGTGDFMLYYAKTEVPLNKIKGKHKVNDMTELYHIYETSDEEALPAAVSLNTCKILIPDEVMTIGEHVGYINVADLPQDEKPFIEVFVVEVFTPSFFWIQLRKKRKMFKKFEDDLHHFYTRKYEQYIIPPVVLEKGLNCACMYNGIWHRGIIKTVKPDFQVTVMFYDYGTLKTYTPEAVYYLHRMFSNVPAQAIPCGLVNTRPCKGSKWSRSATHHFAVRTSEIPLIATILSINTEDNSMMISLTDTLQEEDVHINDWLVEQKLAEHGKMEDKVNMSNLLLFVEENLVFKPEQCYDDGDDNGNNKNSSKNAINMPLVSPQSTLEDKLFKPSSTSTLFDEPKMLSTKENIQDQIFQNDSIPIAFTPNKNNTNPFLQDDCENYFCDQINDEINPLKFMQIWSENLQVQMQITAILNIILNKVMQDSTQKENSNLTNDMSTLNMIRSRLLYANKQMSRFINLINENPANVSENITSSVTTIYNGENIAKNNDVMNIGCPIKHTIPTSINQQPLTTTLCNRKHNLNTYIGTFQNTDTQNGARNPNTVNLNPFMPTNNNMDSVNQFLTDQQTLINRIPPGFGERSNKFKFDDEIDSQNCFANDMNSDLLISGENPINSKTPLKETNPFKLILAGKLQILEPHEEKCLSSNDLLSVISHKNGESVAKHDLINFENNSKVKYTNGDISDDHKNILFDQYFENYNQYFFSDCANNTNNIKNNSFALNEKYPNHNCNINDVGNTMSKIIIDEQSAQYNVHQKEMEKHCFSPSKRSLNNHDLQYIENQYKQEPIHDTNIFNFDQPLGEQDNDFVESDEISDAKIINGTVTFFPNYNLNNCRSVTRLFINNSEYSTLESNSNVDEGYLTRSSTSHTLYSSSPIGKFNEAQSNQMSARKYSSESSDIAAKASCKIPKDIDQLKNCSKACFSFENNEEKLTYHEDFQENKKQNLVTEDVLNFQINIDNTGIKSSNSKENEFKTDGQSTNVPKHLFSDYKVAFQIVELPKRIMHIFHYQREGWLLVDEFVEAFTDLGTSLCMVKLLCTFNIEVQFEEIDKTKNSIEFIGTNSMLPKATSDIISGTNKLQLMTLKSALKVLYTLKIISYKDINDILSHEQFVNDSNVYEIWLITNVYRGFKNRIENGHC